MAENKNTFLMYKDWKELFETLPDEKAGQLIKHLFKYVNDEDPETEDLLIKATFTLIKATLKRDLKKWDKYIDKQRANGQKGGRPKNPEEPQKTQPFNSEPKKADSVSVSDSVSDSKKENNKKKTITDRKEDFKQDLLKEKSDKYTKDLLRDFYMYWSEHGPKDIKMRFEKEKTFGLKARLHTWWKRSQSDHNNRPTKEEPRY